MFVPVGHPPGCCQSEQLLLCLCVLKACLAVACLYKTFAVICSLCKLHPTAQSVQLHTLPLAPVILQQTVFHLKCKSCITAAPSHAQQHNNLLTLQRSSLHTSLAAELSNAHATPRGTAVGSHSDSTHKQVVANAQVSWQAVLFGDNPGKQSLTKDGYGGATLCSLAWMPDGSAVAVMDKCGNLALLDVQGTVHRLQPAASLSQKQPQVPHSYACPDDHKLKSGSFMCCSRPLQTCCSLERHVTWRLSQGCIVQGSEQFVLMSSVHLQLAGAAYLSLFTAQGIDYTICVSQFCTIVTTSWLFCASLPTCMLCLIHDMPVSHLC